MLIGLETFFLPLELSRLKGETHEVSLERTGGSFGALTVTVGFDEGWGVHLC